MAWMLLLLAGMFEIGFAALLKPSQGFTRLWPSLGVVVFGTAAIYLLTRALDTIPVSTAYAVFTGMGAVGVVLIGAMVFDESLSGLRLLFIGLVVAGVIGLRVVTSAT